MRIISYLKNLHQHYINYFSSTDKDVGIRLSSLDSCTDDNIEVSFLIDDIQPDKPIGFSILLYEMEFLNTNGPFLHYSVEYIYLRNGFIGKKLSYYFLDELEKFIRRNTEKLLNPYKDDFEESIKLACVGAIPASIAFCHKLRERLKDLIIDDKFIY